MLQVASFVSNSKVVPLNDNSNNDNTEKKRIRVKPKRTVLLRKFSKRLHEDDKVEKRPPLPIDETELSLCVLLWQSTVIQALYDLAAGGSASESRIIKASATSWFATNGQEGSEFDLVCDLACLNPKKVLKMARKVMREGETVLDGFNFRTIRKEFSDRIPTKRAPRTAKQLKGGK